MKLIKKLLYIILEKRCDHSTTTGKINGDYFDITCERCNTIISSKPLNIN